MERTHSIMRVATTASPVSGDAVREQMQLLQTRARFINATQLIIDRWNAVQKERMKEMKKQYSSMMLSMSDHIGDSQRSTLSQMNLDDSQRSAITTKSSKVRFDGANETSDRSSGGLLDEMIEEDKDVKTDSKTSIFGIRI